MTSPIGSGNNNYTKNEKLITRTIEGITPDNRKIKYKIPESLKKNDNDEYFAKKDKAEKRISEAFKQNGLDKQFPSNSKESEMQMKIAIDENEGECSVM